MKVFSDFVSALAFTHLLYHGCSSTADQQVLVNHEQGVERDLKHASIPVRLIRVKNNKARVQVFQAAIGDPHTCLNEGPK